MLHQMSQMNCHTHTSTDSRTCFIIIVPCLFPLAGTPIFANPNTMEGMLTIVKTITASTTATATDGPHSDHLAQLYAALAEHQSFLLQCPAALADVAAHATKLLHDARQRTAGLLLLNQFLPQCPLDVVETRGIVWTELCIAVLADRRQPSAGNVRLAAGCIAHLLRKSAYVPELSKALSNTLLARLHDALIGLGAEHASTAMALLEGAQRLYAGAAAISRPATLAWLLRFADASDGRLVRQAGRCLVLHQQTRGGGAAGATHADNWSALQLALLGQLHQLLDALYAQTPEVS